MEEHGANVSFLRLPDESLREEAQTYSSRYGKNPYSDFILANGRRPAANQADAIGRLMGVQVRAADGSMRPRRTKADREARREARLLENKQLEIWDQIGRLRAALELLAANNDDPALIAVQISSFDEPEIDGILSKSLNWLIRFENHWNARGKKRTYETSDFVARNIFRTETCWPRPANDP